MFNIVEEDIEEYRIQRYKKKYKDIDGATSEDWDGLLLMLHYTDTYDLSKIRNWSYISWKIGHDGSNKMIDMLISKHPYCSYDNIARGVAHYGHLDIVKYMIGVGAKDYNKIVNSALISGHIDVMRYMISLGARNYEEIARMAGYGGNLDIARWLSSI